MIRNRKQLATSPTRELAMDCLVAGIEAAHPATVVSRAISLEGDKLTIGEEVYDVGNFERILVLGGGKGAGEIAHELERLLGGRIDDGFVVTADEVETDRVTVLPGDHPVPSQCSVESTRRLLEAAREADEQTLVLGVITGGGSAYLAAPAGGISLSELQETTDSILESGATIHEFNAVRKHISELKGGQLAAAAAPATVACLVLSDVVGNDLDVIASGPFVPDDSTFEDALAVVDQYDLSLPASIVDRLRAGRAGKISETPSPGDPVFDSVSVHFVGDGMTSMRAAADVARENGFSSLLLSSRIRGESREVAKAVTAVAEEITATGNPLEPPAVVISGGETTVTVRGDGEGGPNQEFVLSACAELDSPNVVVAAIDTDGIDGGSKVAGAIVEADTILSSEVAPALAKNDAYPVLNEANAIIRTGPTGTNVNDLRVMVVDDGSLDSCCRDGR